MKHVRLEEVQHAVDLDALPLEPMSRRARIERWAELLLSDPDRKLSSFYDIEHVPPAERDRMRHASSPVAVAFADPVLRHQGLSDDTLGEAMRFFELSQHQAHALMCYCHNGASIRAGTIASRLQGMVAERSTMPLAILGATTLAFVLTTVLLV